MKTISKNFKLIILLFLFASLNNFNYSQVSSYNVSSSNSAYSSISGGTVHGSTSNDDDNFNAINIGFTFKYNCVNYTQISINNNGFIAFGSSVSSSYSAISSGSSNFVIAALSIDLQGQAGSTLRTELIGTAPNRTFVVQWEQYRSYNAAGDDYDFQIRLNETSNTIELHYGAFTQNATNRQAEVGLRGASNADFNNRLITVGTHTWATSANGAANNSKCDLRTALKPTSGQKFTFTPNPPAMTYSSSTSADVAAGGSVERCQSGIVMDRIEIVTGGGCGSSLDLTQVLVTVSGTAPLTAISRVHIFYTGTSNTFAATNEFVSGGMTPSATTTFSSTQSLSVGTNYFWVVYDLSGSGGVGQTVTARLPNSSLTIGGVARTPAAQPICSKTLAACSAYPTFSAWYKPNVGITLTGGAVSQWNDQTATAFHLTQATASRRPTVIAGSTSYKKFNYNKRINFVAASQTLLNNGSTSPDIMGANGTFIAVLQKGTTSGTAFAYDANGALTTNPAYQLKPQFRCQTGNGGNGTTYDKLSSGNPAYPQYFNGDFPTDCAFINTSIGTNTSQISNINSISTGTCDNCNNATYNPSVGVGLNIGCVNTAGAEAIENDVSEVIVSNNTFTATQTRMVETYLALKYGITIGGNQNPNSFYNYFASNNSAIFDKSLNVGFNNDIAGIGRDDVSTLNQKQSISVNTSDPVTVGLITIASENDANGNSFSSDRSFLIWGNNGLPTQTDYFNPICFSNLPAGVQAKIQRVWKAQVTNFSQQVTVGFETSLLIAYTPLTNLVLLVDNDGSNWTNATVYSGAVLNGTRIEFAGVTINGTNPYFTLGTINYNSTPLPIELVNFNVEKNINYQRAADISWNTISEKNSSYFEVQRSNDGLVWNVIAKIDAIGNSINTKNYSARDVKANIGINYYRLKHVDIDGKYSYSSIRVLEFNENDLKLYPIPTASELYVEFVGIKNFDVEIYNNLGQKVNLNVINVNENEIIFDTKILSNGVYFIKLSNENESFHKQFIKQNGQ